MNRAFLILSFIGISFADAIEIPARDLSQDSLSKPAGPEIPRAIPVYSSNPTPKSEPKLELALREIQLLKKAAQSAGGDLEVIIRPTGGIHAENLVIPLSKTGAFEVKPGKNSGAVRVESRSVDAQIAAQQEEIAQLKKQIEYLKRGSSAADSDAVPTVVLKPKSSLESRTAILP